MNRRFKLLTIVATIAMTMFGTMVCRAEASAKTNVQNECCSAEKDDDNKVHLVVENLPQFPGGMPAMMEYMRTNVRYPKKCAKEGIEGRSIINFVVDKDGKVTDVKVLQTSGNKHLDKEAMRVIKKMPRWQPGTHHGKVVRVKLTIPVMFKLQPKNSNTTK